MKNPKPKHNMFSNIAYALRNIWKWDKAFYLFFIPSIPLAVLMPLAATYFPKLLIDSVESQQSIHNVIAVIGIYFAVILIADLLRNLCNSKLNMRRYNLSCLYQHAISEKHMRTDYANTDNPEAITKYQHAMNDACSGQCAPEFIWQSLMGLFISLLGVFTYGSVIAIISPWILLFLFLSAFITYLVNRWHRNYIEKNKDKWVTIDRKIGYLQSFSQKFDHAKDIRIYGMFDWLTDMLAGFQKERFGWTKKVSARSLAGTCINALLMLLQNGAAYAILIVMVFNNKISAGDFVFYFGAITGFSAWLNGIGNKVNDITHKSIKIGYYREYFEIEEKYNHEKGCALPTDQELPVDIELNNVSFKYPSADGEKHALKNVSLKIGKGEKLAIVGANGAGKTTLVKLICGFYYPSEGEIKLNGHTIADYNIEDYYSLFSAVFQDIYLLPVTIAEFVASSEKAIDRDRVTDVIRQAGLADKIASLPNGIDSRLMKGVFDDSIEMSGGEKQKLMLARALYKNAPVIVLDEPTAALDPIAENELYLKYNELTAAKTSVYISHRLASTRFCDRIVYLENGEIAECGSHDELMKLGGRYAHMFDLQSHYYKEDAENA
ncbi:MAG: ABC transporter ATP-binding protein [Clostridia bacterium]|nr:ABC transporter ATP-binding protein [Clostridia bacterium]